MKKDIFNFCYYSFYSLTLVYLAESLPKDDRGIKSTDVQKDLAQYLAKRETFGKKVQKSYPNLKFSGAKDLIAILSLNTKKFLDTIVQENNSLSKETGPGDDRSIEIAGTLGAMIGGASESANWALLLTSGEKRPTIQGLAEANASFGSLLPDDIRKAFTELAGFEGQKITADKAPKILELTNIIYKSFN